MSGRREKSPTPHAPAGAPEKIVREKDNSSDKPTQQECPRSKWREQYRVHPAADVFPLMPDDEIAKLGENINANGLKHPICFYQVGDSEPLLLDGRNRLEAMERAGIADRYIEKRYYGKGDPVAHVIGLNIHRRHLTKEQQADLIVAAINADADACKADKHIGRDGGSPAPEKLVQVEPVSKGGRGKKNPLKAKAIAEGKKAGISESHMKRSLAKADPKPKRYAARPLPKPRSGKPVVGLEAVRRTYLDMCADPDVDLDAELAIVVEALREIAGRRAIKVPAAKDGPGTVVPAVEHQPDDLAIPACLDRRARP
jgi:hypothetical protein